MPDPVPVLEPAAVQQRRAGLLRDASVHGPALREALVALYDGWLAGLLAATGAAGAAGAAVSAGVSLVAVGGLGRREVALGSDLDLVLVHDRAVDVTELAERLWYPVWDSGTGLDHAVRTVDEAVAVSRDDLKAALGLLDARHLAGDAALSAALVTQTRAAWRRDARRRVPELLAAGQQRAETFGEVAFLLEPDLKHARGGLRDVHALHALAVAQVADEPGPPVREAARVLLDVRGEVHRRTAAAGRRSGDRLLLQEQDAVADALAYPDADALMASVAAAARAVAYASDTTWRRALPAGPAPRRRLLGARRGGAGRRPLRRPLAEDVLEQGGEVVLADRATPGDDPVLVLRVARAAAAAGLPVAPPTLDRLRAQCPPLPLPWPAAAREELVGLLATGPAAVPVLEALDQAGLLVALLPEWQHVRSKPQRNSYHRFTVDRHLVEAAAQAAALTRRVARPDLLLLGALLHDIGKGLPGDHTEVGQREVARIGPRLGLPPADVDVLVALVRHHLLLPDVATRRDLADPATARAVADAVGSVEVLELLHALTEADSLATGPAAWSAWKASLVAELVRRSAALLAGAAPPPPAPLAPWQDGLVQACAATGDVALQADGEEVTVVAPDRPGLLSLAAGVVALHRLDVRSAWATTRGGTGVVVLRVAPRFGALPDWSLVGGDLRHALDGALPVGERLRVREQAYDRAPSRAAPATVRLVDDASDRATVVEVRAPDGLGVLHRITGRLVELGLDVRTAHVSTLGADVVDAFYVVGPDGSPLRDPALRERVRDGLLTALS